MIGHWPEVPIVNSFEPGATRFHLVSRLCSTSAAGAVAEGALGTYSRRSGNTRIRQNADSEKVCNRGMQGGGALILAYPAVIRLAEKATLNPIEPAYLRRLLNSRPDLLGLTELPHRFFDVRARQKPFQAQASQQNVGRNSKRVVTTVQLQNVWPNASVVQPLHEPM